MDEKLKQLATEYEPTPKEKILLEVLLNPSYRMKSVEDVCRIAECDRSTYYRAFDKPGFSDLYKKKSQEMVKQHIAPVLNSFVFEAKRGSFQHGKVILEMAGVYTEKQQIEHSGGIEQNITYDLSKLTDEELDTLEKMQKKLLDNE